MSSTAVAGLTIFIVLVVILVSGMPIAVALAASSMIAIVQLLDSAAAITTASQKLFQGISIFTLLAIPFFVLAGNIMNKGGIAVRLINFAKVVILLIINVFLLFVGTFMDITPAVLIFTPIFLPICQSFGMSALHFGIMITFNLCIGCITPPVGNILFVGLKVSKRRLEAVMKPLVLFYAAIFVVLMLVTFVPAVSTAIPSMLGY